MSVTRTGLREARLRRGVSAAQLAGLAGISRQTVYAIEAGEYVPNTTLALELARILEVPLDELFWLEGEARASSETVGVHLIGAAAPQGQPVQVCRVGPKLIGVPSTSHPLMLPPADGVVVGKPRGAKAQVRLFPEDLNERRRLLIAGCDPGVSLLAEYMGRYDDVDIVVAPCASRRALDWLKDGSVHVAGTHLRDPASGEYNLPAIRRVFPEGDVKVVTFAVWEQGLVFRAGNPKEIRGIDALARGDVLLINREKGAGSRELLDEKLRAAGIPASRVSGYDRVASGHLPAALAVSLGEADCCVATRSAAVAFGLGFLPLATERYDLVIGRRHARLPAIQALLDVLNRAAIRRRLETLGGYDTSHTGEVLDA